LSGIFQDLIDQMSDIISVSVGSREKIGALEEVLAVVKQHGFSIVRIQSRPGTSISSAGGADHVFHLDFSSLVDRPKFTKMLADVKKGSSVVFVQSRGLSDAAPWFPSKITDLDQFAGKTLAAGAELESDHPGFHDKVYRERRAKIVEIARTYRHGQTIPKVEYNDQERQTWKTVFTELKKLHGTHACRQLNRVFPLLEKECGYSPDKIPQLEDISRFLKSCTGWTLRPVQGLLSSRDFLNGLAFRVFHSTQYIRHHSRPLYTPEPDICHELLGHVPLFADPEFAAFSQEIGLASLGASEDDVKKLATCYWFTVEFGLTREGDSIRAYGAGLLSSFGELEYCLTAKPEKRPFDPFKCATQEYPITTYQPLYFVTESFHDAMTKLKSFAVTLSRPYHFHYDPYTESVTVLDTPAKVRQVVKTLQSQLDDVVAALDEL
jgi:phenylalanine-4-hydroxylase